eukprot:5955797-Prymnesium_polylepis.2
MGLYGMADEPCRGRSESWVLQCMLQCLLLLGLAAALTGMRIECIFGWNGGSAKMWSDLHCTMWHLPSTTHESCRQTGVGSFAFARHFRPCAVALGEACCCVQTSAVRSLVRHFEVHQSRRTLYVGMPILFLRLDSCLPVTS